MIRTTILSSFAAALLATLPTSVQAKTVTLDLTGTVANTTTQAFVFNGRNYVQGKLALDGVSAFDLSAGDIIDATILLDALFTVPASGEQLFAFSLFNTVNDNGQPTTNFADLHFFNSFGPTGLPSDFLQGACSNCLSTITAGGGNPFSFNALVVHMTVDQIAPEGFHIDGASINYQLADGITSAIPEPAIWGMLILGFGVVGAALRRRARPAAAVASA